MRLLHLLWSLPVAAALSVPLWFAGRVLTWCPPPSCENGNPDWPLVAGVVLGIGALFFAAAFVAPIARRRRSRLLVAVPLGVVAAGVGLVSIVA